MPKRSCKVLPLSESSLFNKKRKKKKYAEVAKNLCKKKSIFEIVKKEKEICASFADTPQTASHSRSVSLVLAKVEKALHL